MDDSNAPTGQPLAKVPASALVITGLVGLQGGAALSTRLAIAVGVQGVVTLRLTFAAIMMCAALRPRPRAVSTAWTTITAAGTLLAAHHLCYYSAITRIPLGIATTIEFLGPFTVALAGSQRIAHALWALLALAGVTALSAPGTSSDITGLLFAAGAAACWACYILVSARLARQTQRGQGLALAIAWGAALSLPFGIHTASSTLLRPTNLVLGIAVAVVSTVCPYTLHLEAIRRLRPRVFGILTSLEPTLGALIGFGFLHQRLTPTQWTGLIAVVTASIGATRTAPQDPQDTA